MKYQRIAIVGAGAIAHQHAAGLQTAGDPVELSIFDLNPAARDRFVETFPQAMAFETLSDMLAFEKGADDIVVVATPPKTHASIACEALKAGYHVLVEKPFAMTIEEADAVRDTAEASNRMAAVCDNRFLGQESIRCAREMMQDGALGEVYRVVWCARQSRARSGIEWQPESPWFLQSSQSGGGVVMDWGPYDLAVLYELLQPQSVRIDHAWMSRPFAALPENIREEDIDIEFHAGARLSYITEKKTYAVDYERSSCVHGPEAQRFLIEGTRGTLAIGWTWNHSLTLYEDQEMKAVETPIPVEENPVHFHHRPLYFLRKAIAEHDHSLITPAHFNFKVLQGIYTAADTQMPVQIDNP